MHSFGQRAIASSAREILSTRLCRTPAVFKLAKAKPTCWNQSARSYSRLASISIHSTMLTLLAVLILGPVKVEASGSYVVRGIANEFAAPYTPEDDAEQFVREMLLTVERQNSRDFSRLIDWDEVLNRALVNLPESEASKSFREGFVDTIEGPGGLPASIVTAVTDGGSLTLMRCITDDKGNRALFRLILPNGGFNYFEMELSKNEEGQIRVVDIYPYSAGENISVTLRRAYLPLVGDAENMPNDLGINEGLYIKHASDYSRFADLVAAGEAERAMAIYDTLPEELQNDKNGLLLRLRATQQLGDGLYGEALQAIRELYPNDPSSDLLSIDAYLIAKDFDAAITCIDRLERRVEGDPYLDVQRAAVMIMKEEWDQAEAFARKALDDPGTQLRAYWTLVTVSLAREDYAETLNLLKQMDGKFEMSWADLTEVPEYKGFVASPQHTEWLEYLREKG